MLAVLLLAVVGCRSEDAADTIPTTTTAASATTTTATTTSTTVVAVYQPQFTSVECQFEVPSGREVECGFLEVPEKRSNPSGATIRLAVAIFRSESANPAPDPIVYLDGGPGGHSLEAIPFSFEAGFSPFLEQRDFVMFDQRGVGFSEPGLFCPEYLDELTDIADEDISSDESASREIASLLECRSRLLDDNDVDLTAYNTAESAADVADLRVTLGYADWNLYGISYGTRLALGVMRDHPQGVRSVILDSTLPPEADLMTEGPANFARALRVLFTGCSSDPNCAGAYPGFEQRLLDRVAALEDTSSGGRHQSTHRRDLAGGGGRSDPPRRLFPELVLGPSDRASPGDRGRSRAGPDRQARRTTRKLPSPARFLEWRDGDLGGLPRGDPILFRSRGRGSRRCRSAAG